MKDKIQLIESGLKCDNIECNWENKTIHHKDYFKHIDRECPKCGENILTQQDYNSAMLFHSVVDMVNGMNEVEIETFNLEGLDLSSIISTDDKMLLEQNPDKEFKVSVDLHGGIKFNVENSAEKE